jgi:hypothetical protein
MRYLQKFAMLSPESFKLVSRTNGRLTPEEPQPFSTLLLWLRKSMCVFPNLGPVYTFVWFHLESFRNYGHSTKILCKEANGVSMLTGFSEQECKLFTHAVVFTVVD